MRFILFPCEELNAMNKKTILPISDDLDEAPIWTDVDFKQAVHRVGLKPLLQKKQKINITLDPDIVAWFKQQAGGGEGIKRSSMLPCVRPCRKKPSKKRYGK